MEKERGVKQAIRAATEYGFDISPHGDQWGLFGDYSSENPEGFGKVQNPEGL